MKSWANAWVGGSFSDDAPQDELRHPFNSPGLGDLGALRQAGVKVTLCCGNYDIVFAESLAFVEKAEKAGLEVFFVEGRQQIHTFPLFDFLPEGKEALNFIVSSVLSFSRV